MRLEGKVAIITGSARGLGKATALKFVKEGAKAVVCDVNMDQVNETVAEIKALGGEAIGLKVDVTNR
ncbi:MAG TPA: SDR family NAD(P)-dependent oxidoreductase, partial [Patescibacteria group bacterium]|nr:SDR family NAD(P)-dependent oxidoreductase [Patescibacteria group bacterium]